MSLFGRIRDAAGRRRKRLVYEHFRPQMPLSEIVDALTPDVGIDLQGADGFQKLWLAHLASTPASLWDVMPPASPDAIGMAARGESRLLARTVMVSPETDWHREPFHGVRWPRVHVDSCPFSMPGGDLTLLWHLNRMSYLVDHTAAYRATRDDAHAARIHERMASWARANPWLVGANWLNPMETGLRLLSWSVSLAGLKSAPVPPPDRCELILRSVLRQARFLDSHFSRWAIPNNHLIGEAALLAAFSVYWPIFRTASAWMRQAEDTLLEEAGRQVLADGFHFEHSVNYHMLVLDYFLVYLHARLIQGLAPHASILEQTRALADAALSLVAPSGRMPMIGDDSMPHFVVLRGPMGSPGPLSGEVSFEDFLRVEHARLFTTTGWGRELLALRRPLVHARRFPEAGIDVARTAESHVVFTHGPQHGHPFSHGHLHADAGSFELELSGTPVVVDSGTYLYDGIPGVRAHMRSARAHNTVIVDGVEPMHPAAPFEWQSVATAAALPFGAGPDTMASGCRRHLPGLQGSGVDHLRAVIRVGTTVIIADALSPHAGLPAMGYTAALYLHTPVAPGIAVIEDNRVRLTDPAQFIRVVEVLEEPRAVVDIIDTPVDLASLHSTMYGEAATGTTIRVSVPVEQTVVLVTVIRDPEVAVRRIRAQVGQIGCAIEDGHTRRIVSLRLDPFAVHVGGRPVTVANPPASAVPSRDSDSLEWLDELDPGRA